MYQHVYIFWIPRNVCFLNTPKKYGHVRQCSIKHVHVCTYVQTSLHACVFNINKLLQNCLEFCKSCYHVVVNAFQKSVHATSTCSSLLKLYHFCGLVNLSNCACRNKLWRSNCFFSRVGRRPRSLVLYNIFACVRNNACACVLALMCVCTSIHLSPNSSSNSGRISCGHGHDYGPIFLHNMVLK